MAPDAYHPQWDFITQRNGQAFSFEVKTDYPKTGNLFIPFAERGKPSGVLHPELEADWFVVFRPYSKKFFLAPTQSLAEYIRA